ncbi:MAG: DUF192 domain-containing protein, partial [Proteobacteria bacterium]|nr:DUF192 domain-containing protein [Pseudomonadota bacterium]
MNRIHFRCFLVVLLLLYAKAEASEWKRIRIRERIDVQVEIVSSDEEQILGLGNRFSLPEGTGMLFVYDGVGER